MNERIITIFHVLCVGSGLLIIANGVAIGLAHYNQARRSGDTPFAELTQIRQTAEALHCLGYTNVTITPKSRGRAEVACKDTNGASYSVFTRWGGRK